METMIKRMSDFGYDIAEAFKAFFEFALKNDISDVVSKIPGASTSVVGFLRDVVKLILEAVGADNLTLFEFFLVSGLFAIVAFNIVKWLLNLIT